MPVRHCASEEGHTIAEGKVEMEEVPAQIFSWIKYEMGGKQ